MNIMNIHHTQISSAASAGSASTAGSHWITALGGVALAAGLLSGCSQASSSDSQTPATTSNEAQQCTTASEVRVCDPWVKAFETDGSDHPMTAAFGALSSTTGQDLHLVSAETSASGMTQLHETVTENGTTSMREKDGGFTVPSEGTLDLEPGGSHIMLMGLSGSLQPGDTVTITLHFDDGSAAEFEAPVRQYSGAKESYTDDAHMQMNDDTSEHTNG